MNLGDIDIWLIFDLFLLLLIGMGPKIALVPFLDLTEGMDGDTQRKVARRMVQTAVTTALILAVLGWFLMRLLHFTPGAANIAGGIVFAALHFAYGSPGLDNFLAGYILAWAYIKSGSIIVPVVLHSLGNM